MLSETNSRSRWMIAISFIMFLAILISGNYTNEKEYMTYDTRSEQEPDTTLEKLETISAQFSALGLASGQLAEQSLVPTAALPMEQEEIEENDGAESVTYSDIAEVEVLGDLGVLVDKTELADELAEAQMKAAPKAEVAVASARQNNNASDALEAIAKSYKAVEVTATGYFAGRESTGKDPGHPQYGITYSGLKVLRDSNTISTIAADIKVFPLGTVLYIPGYGYGIVADTGSAIKGHIIDLYFETIDDVFSEWGKKKLDVYVIEQGDGKITEEIFKDKIEEYRNLT